MISKIVLIRHSLTEGNIKRLYYGSTDLPLAEEGRERIRDYKAQGIYPEIPEDAQVFTSELIRTKQTLELIYGPRESTPIPEFNEFSFGEYEMKTYQDLKDDDMFDRWMDDKSGDLAIPGGDSRNGFGKRISAGIDILMKKHFAQVFKKAEEDQDGSEPVTLVVCHGGVISLIMKILLDDLDSNMRTWLPQPGTGFILIFDNKKLIDIKDIGDSRTFTPYSQPQNEDDHKALKEKES